MSADPGIFKAYDIRGLYPDQIDAGVAELIARAFVRVISELEGKPASELLLAANDPPCQVQVEADAQAPQRPIRRARPN